MANDTLRGRQVVIPLTNKSGGSIAAGDVVIVDSTTAASFTSTATAALATDAIGVALEAVAADAVGRICFGGYVPKINLSASASLGDTFNTHSVAKQAAPHSAMAAGDFGEVLGTGTSPAALLWGGMPKTASGDTATHVILYDNTLSGNGTWDVQNISQAYDHLEIHCQLLGQTIYDYAYVTLNNDTTDANYDNVYSGHGTGAEGGRSNDRTLSQIGATANMFTTIKMHIPFYTNALYKSVQSQIDKFYTASNAHYTDIRSMSWLSTAAITRIAVTNNTNASGFKAGSRLQIIGVKAKVA